MTGILYVVATPIGNLGDMSSRAVDVLRSVDLIIAEDTRHSGRLLKHFGIQVKLKSFHEHNERDKIGSILSVLKQGLNVALISDARTPLISDPGFVLIKALREEKIEIIPVPGPCALITALCVSGLPTDRFIFEGFLPVKSTARQNRLKLLQEEIRTIIFYEAPHRILEMIEDLNFIFGEDREVVLARELTKPYETFFSGKLNELILWLQADHHQQKGEFVILLHGASDKKEQEINPEALKIMSILLQDLPVKQAARLTSEITGLPKNMLYNWVVKNPRDF